MMNLEVSEAVYARLKQLSEAVSKSPEAYLATLLSVYDAEEVKQHHVFSDSEMHRWTNHMNR